MNRAALANLVEKEIIRAAEYFGLPKPFDIDWRDNGDGHISVSYNTEFSNEQYCIRANTGMSVIQIKANVICDFISNSSLRW